MPRLAPLLARLRALARGPRLGLLLTLGLASALALLCAPFVTDDAFITLRYARHLAEGEGLRWNPGEGPVEGYSNLLQVLLAALALRLDLLPLALLRGLNLAAALLLVPTVYTVVLRELGRPALAVAAAALIAAHAPLWYWTASGLETALYTLMVTVGVGMVSAEGRRWRELSALPLLAAALLRPEGAAVIAVIGLVLLVDAGGPRRLLRERGRWLATIAVAYGLYTAWRVAFFGDLLPNTVRYKAGAPEPGALVWDLVDGAGLLVAAAALAPLHRLGLAPRIAAALALLYLVMLWDVTPSVAYFHRFFLPVIPCMAILAACAAGEALGAPSRGSRWRGGLLLALALGWSLLGPHAGIGAALRKVDHHRQRILARLRVASYLGANLDRQASVAVGDVGVIGYVLPNPIADAFGLNSREFTGRFALHRKRWVDHIVRQRPDAIVLVSKSLHEERGAYRTDDHFAAHPIFRQDYVFEEAVAGPSGYHYRIYLHRRTPHRRAEPRRLPRIEGGDLVRDAERLRLAIAREG